MEVAQEGGSGVATTSNDVVSQTIIDTILADVNAIVPNFVSLVNSYRLLVGAAEEVHRIPGVAVDVYARSIERFDRSGVLIDILLDLLCCKISFSSDFLALTCAPVDIFRLLANRFDVADTPHAVAEEIIVLEVLRRAQERLRGGPALPPCTPPGGPPYTFATSCFVPPPPPIPPEPPFAPPCFEPRPEPAKPAAKKPTQEPADQQPTQEPADQQPEGAAPERDCGPARPRRLKK